MASSLKPKIHSNHVSNPSKSSSQYQNRIRHDSSSNDSTSSYDHATQNGNNSKQQHSYSSQTSANVQQVPKGPRKICIQKSETGFGFNVRGQISEGGPLKIYNGEFYAPLQQVSAVLIGGAAEKAGLYRGDRILEVNQINVDGATHKQVVDLIKSGGDFLSLTVLSMPLSEVNRVSSDNLNNNSDDSSSNSNDYSDRRSMSVTVPDLTEMKTNQGEKFVVFNVYLSGRVVCSRRYKEFDVFHNLLKREFPDFSFPSLPSKWPFKLSEQQLDARRRGLEIYLDKICSVKVIFETQIVKDFLCLSDTNLACNFSGNNTNSSTNNLQNQQQKLKSSSNESSPQKTIDTNKNTLIKKLNSNKALHQKVILDDGDSATMSSNEYTITNGSINKVAHQKGGNLIQNEFSDLKILLPDKTTLKLTKVKQSSTADEVYKKVLEQLKLDDDDSNLGQYYYLFEIIDQSFERKLRPHESPILINLQNFTTDKCSTCISLRKWYFNLKTESVLAKNPTTLKFLFSQACDDVDRAQVNLQSIQTDIDVNFFRENSRYLDFVKNVYKLEGYGDIVFPHCPCDSRKHGHVIVVLSYTSFKLKACSREGECESQVVEFNYEDIERVDVDDEEMSFLIEVKVKAKANRKIKIYTGFYLYMYDCLLKAKQDHQAPL